MLADNIVLLKANYPEIYQLVKQWEESEVNTHLLIEKAKDGNHTLKYQVDDKFVYVHSKYNPIKEAEIIINQLEEKEKISDEMQIIFYGIGLGYHIEAFIKRYPNTVFSIIEPSVEILSTFLKQKLLKNLCLKNIVDIKCGSLDTAQFKQIIQANDKKVIICEHPVYPQIFNHEFSQFLHVFKAAVKSERSTLQTNYAFKKRWIINSVNNLKVVLQTPSILMQDKSIFNDKTAVLVAAGPSLDFEIENLRKIKKEGMAFIFSVGSAINTLIHNQIYPDAMCTYDPKVHNQLVFKKVNELNIDSIPMIFGSSVGYETLEKYGGPKYHMITSQDTISDFFLRTINGDEIDKINDAPSIAVVTFELLKKLGFSQIILVGQNFAYLKDGFYAKDIDFITEEIRQNNLEAEGVFTMSVDGQEVKTNETFLTMKRLLEISVERFSGKVINTTIGGAKISGTEFNRLDVLINRGFTQNSVRGDEFSKIELKKIYCTEYILKQLLILKKTSNEYYLVVKEIKMELQKLSGLIKHNNKNRILDILVHLNELIRTLEKNEFFTVVVLPINRVEYGILAKAINKLKYETYSTKKIVAILKHYEIFINRLFSDTNLYKKILIVLEETVSRYC